RMPDVRGPLLATFDDGTEIYQSGVSNARGFFEAPIGVFIFGGDFNPNTGTWNLNDAPAYVTEVHGAQIQISPTDSGLNIVGSVDVAGPFDIGIVVANDGTVSALLGASVGNDLIGISTGIIVSGGQGT